MTIERMNHLRQSTGVPRRLALDDQELWRWVAQAPELFVFLDFDGTLVEIAPRPAEVSLSENRRHCLTELTSLTGCSVGVVSGRTLAELKGFIALEQMFYSGCHGLEWDAPDGSHSRAPTEKVLVDALHSLGETMRRALAEFDGIELEDKGMTLAMHYRRAARDTAFAACKQFVRAVQNYQEQGVKLELLSGKAVIEAKPAGATKGIAVSQMLKRYGPTALPIYIGDDLTDESAFDAIRQRGLAILVAEPPRASAATWYLSNPDEVYDFLGRIVRERARPGNLNGGARR